MIRPVSGDMTAGAGSVENTHRNPTGSCQSAEMVGPSLGPGVKTESRPTSTDGNQAGSRTRRVPRLPPLSQSSIS